MTYHQEEVAQLYPNEGWVEQDCNVLLNSVHTCIMKAVENLKYEDNSQQLISGHMSDVSLRICN